MDDLSYLKPSVAKALYKNIKAKDYEESLYDFTARAWREIDSATFAENGFALQAMCEHLEALADGTLSSRNLIINVPPRFSKSTIVGTMFPAWVWAQNQNTPTLGPGVQFLFSSYSLSLATQDSIKCRRLLESKWYQTLWGNRFKMVSDQNTKTRFQNDKNGIRNIVSVGSTTTGLGGNFLIADDPNNALEANSEAIIQSTIEWWDRAWSSRLNDPKTGCRIVIQQRLSEQDITGHILEKNYGDWVHLCLPMRFESGRRFYNVLVPAELNDGDAIVWTDPRTQEGELLWEERFGEEEVSLLEKTMGPYAAAGQLQQRPEPMGGGIIKREWWKEYTKEKYPANLELVVASVDTAYGAKEFEGDFSACTVWGVFMDVGETTGITGTDPATGRAVRLDYGERESEVPRVILMHAWQGRFELHELVQKISDTAKEWKIDYLLLENKSAGISVSQEMRRLFGYEGFAVRLLDPEGLDKVSRTYAIQHLFSEGMVYAPTDPTGEVFRIWAEMVVQQCSVFPKGKHDDLHDTMVYALRFLRRIGMLQRGPERTAELAQGREFRSSSETLPLYPV
jgi:predicted phage terminase large subunit-like protein